MKNKLKTTTTEIGRYGEEIACDYLRSKKYKIIERNFHASHNEIDIIAQSKEYIIFVEVKTRTLDPNLPLQFGTPATAVTYSKQKRTVAAAQAYLNEYKNPKQPRLDVIEIYLSKSDGQEKPAVININHMEDAFSIS